MKQQILHKYTELSEKSHLHFAEQVKKYLETEPEKNEKDEEIVNLPFPGNARYNFNSRLKDEDMQPLSISYMTYVANIKEIDLSFNVLTDKGISILSKLLEYAENIEVLNLKGNQIGDAGCKSCYHRRLQGVMVIFRPDEARQQKAERRAAGNI